MCAHTLFCKHAAKSEWGAQVEEKTVVQRGRDTKSRPVRWTSEVDLGGRVAWRFVFGEICKLGQFNSLFCVILHCHGSSLLT